jgi:hypothetical protein
LHAALQELSVDPAWDMQELYAVGFSGLLQVGYPCARAYFTAQTSIMITTAIFNMGKQHF